MTSLRAVLANVVLSSGFVLAMNSAALASKIIGNG